MVEFRETRPSVRPLPEQGAPHNSHATRFQQSLRCSDRFVESRAPGLSWQQFRTYADLGQAAETLLTKDQETPRRATVERLLSHALGIKRWKIHQKWNQELPRENPTSLPFDAAKRARVEEYFNQAATGLALPYIFGFQQFAGLTFQIKNGVHIAAPESETMAEIGIALLQSTVNETEERALDLGTGSGALAITLVKSRRQLSCDATDISQEAIDLAKENARHHDVLGRVEFTRADRFDFRKPDDRPYKIIFCNPPSRLPSGSKAFHGSPSHTDLEMNELVGDDGLKFFRGVAREAVHHLQENGFIVMQVYSEAAETALSAIREMPQWKSSAILHKNRGLSSFIVATRIENFDFSEFQPLHSDDFYTEMFQSRCTPDTLNNASLRMLVQETHRRIQLMEKLLASSGQKVDSIRAELNRWMQDAQRQTKMAETWKSTGKAPNLEQLICLNLEAIDYLEEFKLDRAKHLNRGALELMNEHTESLSRVIVLMAYMDAIRRKRTLLMDQLKRLDRLPKALLDRLEIMAKLDTELSRAMEMINLTSQFLFNQNNAYGERVNPTVTRFWRAFEKGLSDSHRILEEWLEVSQHLLK